MPPLHEWTVTPSGDLKRAVPGDKVYVEASSKAKAQAKLARFAVRCVDHPPILQHRNGAFQMDWQDLDYGRVAMSGLVRAADVTVQDMVGSPGCESLSFAFLSSDTASEDIRAERLSETVRSGRGQLYQPSRIKPEVRRGATIEAGYQAFRAQFL